MSASYPEPTAAEAMLFFSIVKNTRNKADVDWEAVAADSKLKSAEVAKVRFGQVKRKLGIANETTSPAKAAPAKASIAKASPIKKSALAGETSKVTKPPKTPRGKGKARGKGKVKKEEGDEPAEEIETPTKGKKEDEPEFPPISSPGLDSVKMEDAFGDEEDAGPSTQLFAEMTDMEFKHGHPFI